MTFNLKNKRILLVEDYSVMRATIREMLYSFKAHEVQEVDNGSAALKIMQQYKFDIVLCDYNLGAGKNGLHVLEEARHRKLLSYRAIFIMVTAEQNPGMVLGAMECKPDEYLTKPFTAQQLFSRLRNNSERKDYIDSVTREMANDNLPAAIRNCDKLLKKSDKKMRSELLKLRSELAIKIADFDTAKEILDEVLQNRELTWAKLSQGKVHFLQGNNQLAMEILEPLISQNPMLMEAYDWLAKVYEANDDLLDAQEILNAAVDISPQTILRQK
jgi:CheY-like chemotaxis protein